MNIITDLVTWYQTKQLESTIEILIAIIIIVLSYFLSSALSYIVIKLFTLKKKNYKIKKNSFYKPLKFLFILLGTYVSILILKLPDSVMYVINKTVKIFSICLIANGIANIIKPDSILFNKLKENENFKENKSLYTFINKLVKILVYIIAGFVILSEFGYNLNGVITGLGLGSVVIALAAQDIAKSIFAGVIIFLDRPFSIGDFIEVKNYKGTVEDIKFRSTRVRLLDGSMMTLPNEILTTETITNWTQISTRRYETNLEVMLDTNLDKINKLTNELKEILKKQEYVIPNTVEVNFNEVTSNGMNIYIYLYTDKIQYDEYLEFKQKINLEIMEFLKKENISLAYNSQDIYIRS